MGNTSLNGGFSIAMLVYRSVSYNKNSPKSPGEKLIVFVAPRIFLTGLFPTVSCDYLVGSMKAFSIRNRNQN